jgi:hypothetical protein
MTSRDGGIVWFAPIKPSAIGAQQSLSRRAHEVRSAPKAAAASFPEYRIMRLHSRAVATAHAMIIQWTSAISQNAGSFSGAKTGRSIHAKEAAKFSPVWFRSSRRRQKRPDRWQTSRSPSRSALRISASGVPLRVFARPHTWPRKERSGGRRRPIADLGQILVPTTARTCLAAIAVGSTNGTGSPKSTCCLVRDCAERVVLCY